MSGCVLVVDDIAANVKLLEAKLSSEFFEVISASSGAEALGAIERRLPDVVLLDVMMPDMDGYEACRRIKGNPRTAHLPVVMVTALSDVRDRVRGLEAGADDFLTKPVNDLALFARVRSLIRLKHTFDEWRAREHTIDQFGVLLAVAPPPSSNLAGARVLIVESQTVRTRTIASVFADDRAEVTTTATGNEALQLGAENHYDLILVSTPSDRDPLLLCTQIRTQPQTRGTPLLLVTDEDDQRRLAKALELGVNDYVIRPFDKAEVLVRARTQVRRKHYRDQIEGNYARSLTLALTDAVTSLYNRRYFDAHLATRLAGLRPGTAIGLLYIDVDSFKSVNDRHGHGAGDSVLRAVAERLKGSVRDFDLVARIGGDEFAVVVGDGGLRTVQAVSERICRRVAALPIDVPGLVGGLSANVSVGAAVASYGENTAGELIERADRAMYLAKAKGGSHFVLDVGSGESPDEASGGSRAAIRSDKNFGSAAS